MTLIFSPLSFCNDVEFVSNKDTIYIIMQYLQTCYQDEYKLSGKSQ